MQAVVSVLKNAQDLPERAILAVSCSFGIHQDVQALQASALALPLKILGRNYRQAYTIPFYGRSDHRNSPPREAHCYDGSRKCNSQEMASSLASK
jgi:hypothetical protein